MSRTAAATSLLIVILLAFIPCAFTIEISRETPSKFVDVPADAWYWNDLDYALERGYIQGTSASLFTPDGNITRGQFVTILGRMLKAPVMEGRTHFTDVDETSYYAPYVLWAAQMRYVNGTSSTTFEPDALITFEQMGTLLANYINEAGVVLEEVSPATEYKDASSISAYATSSMDIMRKCGLITPDANGNVNPQQPVSRAEGTVSLVRLARAMELRTSYADLIEGAPQLILTHEPDDLDAIDNNVRYMLKSGINKIMLHLDLGSRTEDLDSVLHAYITNYRKVVSRYLEFGYTKATLIMGYAGGDIGIRFGTGDFSEEELSKYREAALTTALTVRKELWSSGRLKSTMTQKEKAKVYFDWLAEHCTYDNDAVSAGGTAFHISALAYGALVNGRACCNGYTAAYNLFLKLEGIDCSTERTEDHIWTTATLDDVVYHIDVTWGSKSAGPDGQYFAMTPEASWARFE